MRVNTGKALRAWTAGKMWKQAESIWSNGTSLYSYDTELARKDGETVYLNVTRYSYTTSRHQNALKKVLPDAVHVDGIPFGGYINP
jgi:hypothetical protein